MRINYFIALLLDILIKTFLDALLLKASLKIFDREK